MVCLTASLSVAVGCNPPPPYYLHWVDNPTERTMVLASALNAKVHLLSGILIGAGALLLMKQMCDRKNNSRHAGGVQPQHAADTDTRSE